MSTSTKIILALFLILIIYSVYQYRRTRHYIAIGSGLAAHVVPYEQHPKNPSLRILFVGDSSAAGTGADKPEDSVAGRFGQRYPTAEIINLGINGTRTVEVPWRLKQVKGQHFDLILMHTGGNDVVRFTNLKKLEQNLRLALIDAKKLSDTVVVLHGGNVGTAKLFPKGTRWLLAFRTRQVRTVFLRVTKELNVHYVDLWRRGKDDPFFANPDAYYATDFFHPSSLGYQDWYDHIVEVLPNSIKK